MKIHAEAFHHLVRLTQENEPDAVRWMKVIQKFEDGRSELVGLRYTNKNGEALVFLEKDEAPVCPNCKQETRK